MKVNVNVGSTVKQGACTFYGTVATNLHPLLEFFYTFTFITNPLTPTSQQFAFSSNWRAKHV